jgi:hypothetical protein
MKQQKDIYRDVYGQTEDALQQKCYFWFWNEYPNLRKLLFSVPNGGWRRGKDAKTLQRTGLTPGVSDLILLFNGKAFLIELKKNQKSSQNKEQLAWQLQVEAQGFLYFIIRSLEEFKILINTILL